MTINQYVTTSEQIGGGNSSQVRSTPFKMNAGWCLASRRRVGELNSDVYAKVLNSCQLIIVALSQAEDYGVLDAISEF